MKKATRLARLILLDCLAGAIWMPWAAMGAAPVSVPTATNWSSCLGCHGTSGLPKTANSSPVFPDINATVFGLSEDWMKSAVKLSQRMGSADVDASNPMKTCGDSGATTQNVSDCALQVWEYLVAVRDGKIVPPIASAFGETPVGSTLRKSFSFDVYNYRPVQATVSVTVEGANASDFQATLLPTNCAVATSAAPSPACNVNVDVDFKPTGLASPNPRQAQLKVGLSYATGQAAVVNPSPSTVSPAPAVLALTGPVQTALQFEADVNGFSTQVNVTKVVKQTLTNRSSASVELGAMTGLAGSPFSVDVSGSNCKTGTTLAANGTCELVVQFTPTQAQPYGPTSLLIPYTVGGTASTSATIAFAGKGTAAPQGSLSSTGTGNFGQVVVGQSSNPTTVSVCNGGAADLTLSSVVSSSGDFTLGGTCAANVVLVPDSATPCTRTCTVQITFRPTALGARPGSLTIAASNAANSPLTLALSGTGIEQPAPKITFAPTSLAFGDQTIGGLYQEKLLRITNNGQLTLSIASVAVQGAGFSSANAVSNCVKDLAPGAFCEMAVRFVPGSANTNFTGSVQVASNMPGSPHTVALTGRGTVVQIPSLVWLGYAGGTLSFGTVNVGTASTAQTLTLKNNGPGGARLDVVNAVGSDGNAYSVSGGTCTPGTTVLPENASCTVGVSFVPGSAGVKSAQLQVASNGSSPPAVSLAGTGMGLPGAQLTVSESGLNFGTVRLGAKSEPRQVSLTAGAATSVTVNSTEVTGPFKVDMGSCPATAPFALAPGSSCTLQVSYVPSAEGTQTGRVAVVSSASSSGHELALSGLGEPAAEDSAGGCSLAQGRASRDPTLWLLVVLAVLGLFHRAWRARAAVARPFSDSAP